MPGRFILGVGTGENLNEHIFGDRWPPARMRRTMLKEAVELIRLLWRGKQENFSGEYYQVENARLYTLPEEQPPIVVAAGGPNAAKLAGEIGDGFVGTTADRDLINVFDQSGGAGKPRYGELTVCRVRTDSRRSRGTPPLLADNPTQLIYRCSWHTRCTILRDATPHND